MTNDDAKFFTQCISAGVSEALDTCRFFLGVETEAFENADIHPEYVTTVEVAKKLTGFDRYVSLETHMKSLRRQAGGLARLRSLNNKEEFRMVGQTLKDYRFGKKDSWRIDVVVRSSGDERPPFLIAEAKLGVSNIAGIKKDIDRVLLLLEMYYRLKLLQQDRVYGAVLFHSAAEGAGPDAAVSKAEKLISEIKAYLSEIQTTKSWLFAKVGLLSAGAHHDPIQGYWEPYGESEEDGECVFAKTSFTFAPGLVLMSGSSDVMSAF